MNSETNETINIYNNPIPLGSFEKFYLDSETADVHFVFGSVDGVIQRVPAHKILLAAASDVFKAMFYGPLKETADVAVDGVSAESFETFLQLFYNTKIKLSKGSVADVMNLADKYNVTKCSEMCVQFLKAALTNDDICAGLTLAIIYGQTELIDHCDRQIMLNTKAIFKSDSFLHCGRRTLAHIMRMNLLSCSEPEVFEACISWVKSNSEQVIVTKDLIQEHLGDLFYEIRFKLKNFLPST